MVPALPLPPSSSLCGPSGSQEELRKTGLLFSSGREGRRASQPSLVSAPDRERPHRPWQPCSSRPELLALGFIRQLSVVPSVDHKFPFSFPSGSTLLPTIPRLYLRFLLIPWSCACLATEGGGLWPPPPSLVLLLPQPWGSPASWRYSPVGGRMAARLG